MGLKAPASHLLNPADYINEMKRLNTQQMAEAATEPASTTQ